jgi:hypothetical protein
MATKLGRKALPSGKDPSSFKYVGRPAGDQDDFGPDVGIVDMACVNQFGEANNSKYYHAGVVQSGGAWFVYLEWGRISGGKSWSGSFGGGDFQFAQCSSEDDARSFFQKQCRDKNIKRLEKKKVGNTTIWAGKNGKDGYIVQRLATRERGLPDAYGIKDDSGVAKKATKKVAKKKSSAKKIDAQPQVIKLCADLVGGTADYARSASQATGIVPTMAAIHDVRDNLLPDALGLLKKIGNDEAKQLKSKQLQDLSKYVATIVPRPIPRGGDPSAILLSTANIFAIQQDLDTFEAALNNEDFDEVEIKGAQVDPNQVFGRNITWIDPNTTRGRYVAKMYQDMTNNRHGHLRNKVKVLNIFEVEKPDLRSEFNKRVKALAKARQAEANSHIRAGLQPKKRTDVSDISDLYDAANVCVGIHGTRAVNVQPILASNLRLPKSLSGVHVTGSAFGHGIYFATDYKKSHGYTGGGYYGGGGTIAKRGFFMFLCDLALGKPYMAKTTMWNAVDCPEGHDSIFAEQSRTSVANDEHVIFDPHQQNIRYIIEGEL